MKCAVVVATILLLAWTSSAWAGRPLETEDAGTLDPANFEIELSGDYIGNHDDALWVAKGVFVAGILPSLEARVELPFVLVDPDGSRSWHAGVGDSIFGVKYRFVDERPILPALLGSIVLRLPTGDTERGRQEEFDITPLGAEGVDLTLLGVMGKAIGPFTLHGNVAYTFVTANRDLDYWTLAAGAEYRVTKALSLVAEVLGFLSTHHAEPDTGRARGGVVYAIGDNLKLDAAIGHGLTRESPRLLLTVGMTLAF